MKKILTLIAFTLLTSQNLAASVGHAYVSDFSSNTVSVIDISTNTVVATILSGSGPENSAVTPDGKHLYVPNYGTNPSTVNIIDTLSNSITQTITLVDGLQATTVVIMSNGAKAYVANRTSTDTVGVISVINASTQQLIKTIQMPSGYANTLIISPDNAFAYAVSSGYIVKIDTSTDMIINTLPLPNYFPKNYFPFPNLLAITPDGKTLYLSNSYARAFGGLANPIYAIDAASLTVIASIPNSFSTEGVVIRPDGAFAYILSQQAALVYVINTTTNTISSTISVTGAGSEMAISPEGSQIYVTAFQDNRFYIIDTSTQSISATITSANFNQPASPAPTPDGSFVYVCNLSDSGNVCQVNPITEAVSLPIPVGVNPRYIAIVQPVHVSGLNGSQRLNQYGTQTETYNLLTWNLPTAGVVPVSYRIYRDAALTTLAGTSDTFSFIDHNLNPGQTYDYYVVSVAYNGDTSLSAHVTVSPL